jgi:hypothetical protein
LGDWVFDIAAALVCTPRRRSLRTPVHDGDSFIYRRICASAVFSRFPSALHTSPPPDAKPCAMHVMEQLAPRKIRVQSPLQNYRRCRNCVTNGHAVSTIKPYSAALRKGVTSAFPKTDEDSGIIQGGHVIYTSLWNVPIHGAGRALNIDIRTTPQITGTMNPVMAPMNIARFKPPPNDKRSPLRVGWARWRNKGGRLGSRSPLRLPLVPRCKARHCIYAKRVSRHFQQMDSG